MSACFVCNALSLGMFAYTGGLRWRVLDGDPRQYLASIATTHDVVHAIGHRDIAQIVGFPFRRESVEAEPGDILLICQYRGPRLPEGTVALPENATILWYVVEILA